MSKEEKRQHGRRHPRRHWEMAVAGMAFVCLLVWILAWRPTDAVLECDTAEAYRKSVSRLYDAVPPWRKLDFCVAIGCCATPLSCNDYAGYTADQLMNVGQQVNDTVRCLYILNLMTAVWRGGLKRALFYQMDEMEKGLACVPYDDAGLLHDPLDDIPCHEFSAAERDSLRFDCGSNPFLRVSLWNLAEAEAECFPEDACRRWYKEGNSD